MTPEQKAWIDGATYVELLRKWRFAPCSDSIFQGEAGDYYSKVFAKYQEELTVEQRALASKQVGWK